MAEHQSPAFPISLSQTSQKIQAIPLYKIMTHALAPVVIRTYLGLEKLWGMVELTVPYFCRYTHCEVSSIRCLPL
jgi:hypothetical protein